MESFWLAVAFLVSASILGYLYRQRRQTLRELAALARRKGLTFSPLDLIGLHDRYYDLEIIRQGHNRHAWNVLYGATEAGLLAVFRYRYDIGFGIDQDSRQWWIAVVERSAVGPAWHASPASQAAAEPRPALDNGAQAWLGPFLVRADREETIGLLQRPETSAIFSRLSPDWQAESRGLLLAFAAPAAENDSSPDRLIDAAVEFARAITPAG